jgi:hypothetical protein
MDDIYTEVIDDSEQDSDEDADQVSNLDSHTSFGSVFMSKNTKQHRSTMIASQMSQKRESDDLDSHDSSTK